MASIERTAYPRFQQTLSQEELNDLHGPTDEQFDFVFANARGERQRLTLLKKEQPGQLKLVKLQLGT